MKRIVKKCVKELEEIEELDINKEEKHKKADEIIMMLLVDLEADIVVNRWGLITQ